MKSNSGAGPANQVHKDAGSGDTAAVDDGSTTAELSRDPVCGMTVAKDPDRKVHVAGADYYFCSDRCVEKFSANPRAYLQPAQPVPPEPVEPRSGETVYTCPMHPEIRRPVPGALEPVVPELQDREWLEGLWTNVKSF